MDNHRCVAEAAHFESYAAQHLRIAHKHS